MQLIQMKAVPAFMSMRRQYTFVRVMLCDCYVLQRILPFFVTYL